MEEQEASDFARKQDYGVTGVCKVVGGHTVGVVGQGSIFVASCLVALRAQSGYLFGRVLCLGACDF